MSDAVTVVISAAGLGTRLGLNTPKALVTIGGKAVLQWQLEMLADCPNVIVVAGFRAQDVVDLVRSVRRDVLVCLNHEFTSTGTAASLAKAAGAATEWVLSLDGDLLVRSEDLARVMQHPEACLGVIPRASKKPVFATVEGDRVVALSQDTPTPWEWSGLVKLRRAAAEGLGRGHVYLGLQPHLPMAFEPIDCVEIDEIEDIDMAEAWVRRLQDPR